MRGIIFGEMLDCVSPGAAPDSSITAILNALDGFDGPIAIGLRSGHVSRQNVTLTFGVEAELTLGDEAHLTSSRTGGDQVTASPRHIHLIGICGTAMASLAGLLAVAGPSASPAPTRPPIRP